MFEVASAFWLHTPLIYVIIPWTIAGIACSARSWRAFAIFFGVSAVALVAMMFVVDLLPDVGGEWPRDEAFYWWALVLYALPALVVCSVVAGIAERIRERRFSANEEFE